MSTLMFAAPINDLKNALEKGKLGTLNPVPWAIMMGNCIVSLLVVKTIPLDVPQKVPQCFSHYGLIRCSLLFSTTRAGLRIPSM